MRRIAMHACMGQNGQNNNIPKLKGRGHTIFFQQSERGKLLRAIATGSEAIDHESLSKKSMHALTIRSYQVNVECRSVELMEINLMKSDLEKYPHMCSAIKVCI